MVVIPKYPTSLFMLTLLSTPAAQEKVWNLVSNELTLLLWHVHDQGPLQLFPSNLFLQLIETTPTASLRKSCLFKYHQDIIS